MIQCNADLLQLFLAKKDGVWLTEADVKKGVSDTSGLKPMDLAGAPLNSVDLSEEDVQIQLTMDEIKAGKVPVHVLVVVPEHNKVRSCAEVLLGVILRYMILRIPTTETEPNIDFKDQLCEFYGCFSRRKSWVRCMPLDIEIPEALVIASYLFRRSNEFLAFMKIPDIDDVRNGLLLFKPLKYAFDRLQISFIL